MSNLHKIKFAVYKIDRPAKYHMAYICTCCSKPALATGEDMKGLFSGECTAYTSSTIMAS